MIMARDSAIEDFKTQRRIESGLLSTSSALTFLLSTAALAAGAFFGVVGLGYEFGTLGASASGGGLASAIIDGIGKAGALATAAVSSTLGLIGMGHVFQNNQQIDRIERQIDTVESKQAVVQDLSRGRGRSPQLTVQSHPAADRSDDYWRSRVANENEQTMDVQR